MLGWWGTRKKAMERKDSRKGTRLLKNGPQICRGGVKHNVLKQTLKVRKQLRSSERAGYRSKVERGEENRLDREVWIFHGQMRELSKRPFGCNT